MSTKLNQVKRYSITHLVSPVGPRARWELLKAQALTFESFFEAQKFASRSSAEPIRFCAAALKNEKPLLPEKILLSPISGCAIDRKDQKVLRRLPYLNAILDSVRPLETDFLIYSNIDIALQKNFYVRVRQLLKQGFEALAINRRTINPSSLRTFDLEHLYRLKGRVHQGSDCFVISREIFEHLQFNELCVGIPHVGATFIAALSMLTDKFKLIEEEKLTFHVGDDRVWSRALTSKIYQDNLKAGVKTIFDLHLKGLQMTPEANWSLQNFRKNLSRFKIEVDRI